MRFAYLVGKIVGKTSLRDSVNLICTGATLTFVNSKLKYEICMTYDGATTNDVGTAILTKPNDSAHLFRAYTQNSNYFFRLYGDNVVQAVKYDNTIGVNMTFASARFLWLVPIE